MYKNIKRDHVEQFEKEIRDYWQSIDLLGETMKTREGNKPFVWYEGPPTANGRPGIHHVLARALKDAPLKYRTMKGDYVVRKAGWDTHGLPVELEVEKALGFNDKNQIEEYGIEEFCNECRKSVYTYEDAWREMTNQMGFLIDLDDAYFTLHNDYIETEWWILNKVFNDGLMYEGHKILPYCTRCGTGLASHEVALGYKETTSDTVICKFRCKDEDAYYLAWTTTPWTLAANVALTVHPDEDYVKVKHNGELLYLGKALLDSVMDGKEYEIVDTVKGKDLEYREYEQLMPFAELEKKACFVTVADYVTTSDGTGIVHTAPAFGDDDYNTGVRYDLPVCQPVNEQGVYTTTPWEGRSVLEDRLAVDIMIWLSENGKLFHKQKVKHNYPHCWRCDTPLLYYAKPGWYIQMTKLRDKLIKNNNTVKWFPDYVGEKRFGNWLENVNDWAISRSRYWGTPINIWRCECGHISSIASRKELVERAIEEIDESIELHRPHIDRVHIKCEKCGEAMSRIEDVLDCWFDSGAMPYAQFHYPFENKEIFEKNFPADYIVEGVDQTRGWFYSLLAIATLVHDRAPYKQVLVNDLVLDKDGKKMSKSKGNTVDPFETMQKNGADALRWYMYYVSPAWLPTKFDKDAMVEVSAKFFGTLENIYNFFSLYANTDNLNVSEFKIPYENLAEIDKWLLSKLNKLIKYVEEQFAVFDMTKLTRAINEFVIEDFSNWYIRRNRRRFWGSELTDDKKAVYQTTLECLDKVCRLIAPMVPYTSEAIYRNLTGEKSVHLAYYPEVNEEHICDKIEERMDLVINLVKLGRAAREESKIKIRQPLHKIYIDGAYEGIISDLTDLIKEELNIKDVIFEKELGKYMNFVLKPNFRALGPVLGKNMGEFTKKLGEVDQNEWAQKLKSGEKLVLELSGENKEFGADLIDIQISAKEGLSVVMENNVFVILDTELDAELISEGFAREFISKIQKLRKDMQLEMSDRIKISYSSTDKLVNAIEKHLDYIKFETLCVELERVDSPDGENMKINEEDSTIKIEKA